MRASLLRHGLALAAGWALAACPGGGQGTETSEGETGECDPGTLNCLCLDNGCDHPLVCASGLCVAVDSTTTTTSASSTTASETTTSSGPGTSTGSSGDSATTAAPECGDGPGPSEECVAERPFCDAGGMCVDCTGIASCATYTPDEPVCDPTSGKCVQCTADDATACTGSTPVCDLAAQACVKCSDHAQCSSGACDLATGACFPADSVLWVDRQVTCGGDGSMNSPFCEIQDAVGSLVAADPTVVRVKPGGVTYKTKIDVAAGAVVAILGDGGAPMIDVTNDAVQVNDGARVYMNQLQIVGSSMVAGKGLVCLAGEVWTERVEISSREAVAIDGFDCKLRLRRSRVYLNPGGGLKLNGGSTRIENSFVTSNGTAFSTYGGIYLSNFAELTTVFATLAGNNADKNADSLHCVNPGLVGVRNSVVFGQSQTTSVTCVGAEASESVVDSTGLAGSGVKTIASAEASWFKDPANGDFHIKATAPFKDVAVWRAGDPTVDYDGAARPTMDSTPDYAGADRLP